MGRAARVSAGKAKQRLAKVESSDNRESLSDKAYAAILKGLFDKSIPAGAELSQTDLVRLLGTTEQPLRDELKRLEAEGLVAIQARS